MVIKIKLGEALQEISYLEARLDALGSRIRRDLDESLPALPNLEEIFSVGNRIRDLKTSVAWTYQQVKLSGIPLGAYIVQRDVVLDTIAALGRDSKNPDIRFKIDQLMARAKDLNIIVDKVRWAADLQVPEMSEPKEASPEEEG